MSRTVVNTSLSRRKRNIGGNMVTGCELVVFLYSATDRDRLEKSLYFDPFGQTGLLTLAII